MKGTDAGAAEPEFSAFISQYSEFSDEDTYALRIFKERMVQKTMFKYAEHVGGTVSFATRVYDLIRSESHDRPRFGLSFAHMFMARERMRPALWFFKVGERLPEEVRFKASRGAESVYKVHTCGHLLVRKMAEEGGGWKAAAESRGLIPNKLKNVFFKRRTARGTVEFRCMPSASLILALKDEVNPDYWFVFPDELSDAKERKSFEALAKRYELAGGTS